MSFAAILFSILRGLDVTLLVTLYGMCFAVPFALSAGISLYFAHGWPRLPLIAVVEFWRSTPILVLMFMFYYALPVIGIDLPAATVAAMTLGLHIGAYGCQSVRAALQALDRSQVEAGLAIGLKRPVVLWTIELPQMLTAMLPTFVNHFIQLVKGTAFVALITMTDMTEHAKEISELTFDPLKIYSALLLAYFALLYPATIFGRWLEHRLGRRLGPLVEARAGDV